MFALLFGAATLSVVGVYSSYAAAKPTTSVVQDTLLETFDLPQPEGMKDLDATTQEKILACNWDSQPSGAFKVRDFVKFEYTDFNLCLNICGQLKKHCTGVYQTPKSKKCVLNLGPWVETKAAAPATAVGPKFVMLKADSRCETQSKMDMVKKNSPAHCGTFCRDHSKSEIFSYAPKYGICYCCSSKLDSMPSSIGITQHVYRDATPATTFVGPKIVMVKANYACFDAAKFDMVKENSPAVCGTYCKDQSIKSGLFAYSPKHGLCYCCSSKSDSGTPSSGMTTNFYRVDAAAPAPPASKAYKKLGCKGI